MTTFDKIIEYSSDLLYSHPDAKNVLSYLDNRISRDTQKKFGFGYFPDNKNLPELIKTVGEDELASLSLLYDKSIQNGIGLTKTRHSTLENHNLIMPYRNSYGEIIGIVGRSILSDDDRQAQKVSKYKNTSFDKRKNLFGLFEAKRSIIKNNCCFIVEGQFDCISAHEKMMCNVVALGSSSMTLEQCALLLRYTKRFVLLFDNDQAGIAGSDRVIKNFAKYADITVGKIPVSYKDLCEFVSENSPEYFNQYLI